MKKSHYRRHHIRQYYEIIAGSDVPPPLRLVTRKAKIWHRCKYKAVYYCISRQIDTQLSISGIKKKIFGYVYFLRFKRSNPLYNLLK